MSTSLQAVCDTLSELADETWDLMSLGLVRTDERAPDERSFTDHHFLHLERKHRPQIRMWLFSGSDEELTGADVEWWVGDGSGYVRMLLQAKRLDRNGRYAEAGRNIGKTPVRQVDRLVEICDYGIPSLPGGMDYLGLTPVYLFYNGEISRTTAAHDLCANTAVGPKQRGCTITHARMVQRLLGPARPRGRRYLARDDIAAFTLPWRCLVCCSRRIGTPAGHIAAALRSTEMREQRDEAPQPQMRIGEWPPVDDRPGNDDGPSVRVWARNELPVDPSTAPDEPEALLEVADGGWRPGGRLLVMTTLGMSQEQ
jgi:hypothetical protein